MKTSLRLILAAGSILPLAGLSAQTQQPDALDSGAPRHHGKAWGHPGLRAKLENLTPSERAELKAAHGKIKGNPQLVAARQAVASATTPEAVKAARESLRQTRKSLLLQADPALQPVLDKLASARVSK